MNQKESDLLLFLFVILDVSVYMPAASDTEINFDKQGGKRYGGRDTGSGPDHPHSL